MIRHFLACLLLTTVLAVPATAAGKAKPKLTQEAKDGVQTTQDNITRMKLKKAQQPPLAPPPPSLPTSSAPAMPPSVN